MDDPAVPKRLEDAITVVGTCTDMCPRFERYRRERENNLFQWETVCSRAILPNQICFDVSFRYLAQNELITNALSKCMNVLQATRLCPPTYVLLTF